ncbi:MucB/RseB C-terminal domain-containing protein [Nitrosomonas sp. Nm166]|uniref:MucB/RseB C-terminal domain-containing protein n=1 Tax=Nitrosomonas sp. Nm166 TaxID=1881054 RepID=UPI0008E778B4|nr:MucB/RseB C-terminal domain-containing protein [Nitrosomonas sp. Nm166]SFE65681.1 sigma-E factor negative regulatory protein RseB [Nitrosomonas sp. Nm166]
MTSRKIITLFFLLTFGFQVALAQELPRSSESALGWLKKMADAPRQRNYSGIFVYYADGHMETSRMVHKVDKAGEHERIEVLDGIPRVVFRNNDEMKCYLPDSKKIYTEKRWFRKFFPNLLPSSYERIDNNYYVKEIKRERISGRECQVLSLIPRDSLRYGHQFWIDTKTGLLIKVAVFDASEIVEQFAFVQLEIDGEIPADLLKPDQSMIKEEWKVTNLATSILRENELKWQIRNLPAGFTKLVEMKRNLIEKSVLVDHIALSDGLATISIFIEPILKDAPAPVPGFFTSRGAINIYIRTLGDNKITTVGEAPLETIKLIGDSVSRQN